MRRAALVALLALVTGCAEPVKDCPTCGGAGVAVQYVKAERKSGMPTVTLPGDRLTPVSGPCRTCGGDGRR